MASFRISSLIDRPIQEVFDFAVDQVGSGRWQFQTSVAHLAGEANAAGSTYERTVVSGDDTLVHTYELTTVAPPFRFEVRSTSGEPGFTYDYTFVLEGDGTRVFMDVDSESDSIGEVDDWLASLKRALGPPGAARPTSAAAYSGVTGSPKTWVKAWRRGPQSTFGWAVSITVVGLPLLQVATWGVAYTTEIWEIWAWVGGASGAMFPLAFLAWVFTAGARAGGPHSVHRAATGVLAGFGILFLGLSGSCFAAIATV
jgi:hypothetical protein